ncbi:hypothetical protein AAG570_009794 [Ranatra chinensis]|uniref:CASP-like protein n=1 Tax=Ranatra chinensis TaxID=642074 RepID=A0ABD0Z0X5_9HEMI
MKLNWSHCIVPQDDRGHSNGYSGDKWGTHMEEEEMTPLRPPPAFARDGSNRLSMQFFGDLLVFTVIICSVACSITLSIRLKIWNKFNGHSSFLYILASFFKNQNVQIFKILD